MIFILAEKHKQAKAYANGLRGEVSHPSKYITEVDNSKTLPSHPKIQLSYLQGHAYELDDAKEYDKKLASWDYKYLPIFPKHFKHKLSKSFKKYSGGRKHIKEINSAIIDNHAKVWLGSDPDREGEGLIWEYMDLNHLDKYVAGRIWNNHGLTVSGLVKTFHNILDPDEKKANATASHAREEADWKFGINLSRGITDIARKYGYKDGAYTAGRVQSPTLKLITERRKAREDFTPTTSYRLSFLDKNNLNFLGSKKDDDGKLNKAMFKTKDAAQQAVANLNTAPPIKAVSNKTCHQSAPKLPKTNDMQGYIVKHAHISAQQAANKVLEPMYDSYNAQTYPRTECNLITKDDFNALKKRLPEYRHLYSQIIGKKLPDKLFNHLEPRHKYVDFTGKKVQKQGHGAITPNPENKTMSYEQYQKLSFPDKVDYKYVLACTLAMFADDHAYQELKIDAQSGDYTFRASNKSSLPNDTDWKQLFPDEKKKKSQKVPADDYKSGGQLVPNSKYADDKGYYPKPETTKPPTAITESNLVRSIMPKYDLGTSSTRASIIASLKHTKLIESANKKVSSKNLKKNEFMPTDKGIICLELLHYTHLMNLAKVASWQKQMDAIADKKLSFDDFMHGIDDAITDDIKKMPKHQYKFSIKPSNKPKKFQNIKKTDTGITCPRCKKGTLQLLTMDMHIKGHVIPIGFYSCSERSCKFSASNKFCGVKITPDVLRKIINGDFPMHKFHSYRKDTDFKARLYYGHGKVQVKFPKRKPHYDKVYDIRCPKCKKGKIALKTGKRKKDGKPYAIYICTNEKCKFITSRTIAGVKLTPDMLKHAIKGDMPYTQFTSRKGKPFTATLKYRKGSLQMEFKD